MRVISLILVMHIITSLNATHKADWTVLTYIQTRNNLNSFVPSCLHAMSQVGSSKQANLLVEWYQPKSPRAARYKIEKNRIIIDEKLADETTGCSAQELFSAMQWAARKYPAKKYCLILRNHGLGILDPLPGFWHASLGKGILHNAEQDTYMDYEQLSSALKNISASLLGNNKIDVLCMDACLMGMLEVGYQVRDYVQYFVASQEVAWATSWRYDMFLQPLLQEELSAEQLAQNIVRMYKKTNAQTPRYNTLSAVQTSKIDTLKASIDKVISALRVCRNHDNAGIKDIIMRARAASLQFYEPCYVDLYSFYINFIQQLEIYRSTVDFSGHYQDHLEVLKHALNNSMKLIKAAVIAHTASGVAKDAAGISVYFPQEKIHFSYAKNEFAQESLWLCFLQSLQMGSYPSAL